MKSILKIVVLFAFIMSCRDSLAAIVITFDELPPTGSQGAFIPEDYAGFFWENFGYADPLQTPYNPSGYVNGTVSPTNIAFNVGGGPSRLLNDPFEFVGAYFTGAFNDGLNITVDGYLNGELIDSKTIITSYYSPTWSSFNWLVDELNFSAFGGVPVTPPETLPWFAMDNFTYVPEPGTITLLGFGTLLLRKRRS